MRRKFLLISIIVIGLFTISSCDKENLFKQPSIEVTGYTLKELPGDKTYLLIDILVTNNDSREANIDDVEYNVVVEGYEATTEKVQINQKIPVGTPLALTLPLTFVTNDAIQLLTKLDKGEELAYVVTGIFHVENAALNWFDLPIDIEGTASVDVGFEEFYEQPDITVDDLAWTYTINGLTSYTVDVDVNCSVKNMDIRNVVIDEVEYIATIEGVKSTTHLYSDSYSTNINIAGNETISLRLPVTLNLDPIEGAALVLGLTDGFADFVIEGTFHAITVDGGSVDFVLPLYDTGNVPTSQIVQ